MGIPITHDVYMPWHLGDPFQDNRTNNTHDDIYNDDYEFSTVHMSLSQESTSRFIWECWFTMLSS